MIEFKHKEDMNLFFTLHPLLLIVIADMHNYCSEKVLDFVITDTVSTYKEDKLLNRVSNSHRTRRAIDLKVYNWDLFTANKFAKHFNEKYKDISSISSSDYKPRMVVLHDNGNGYHAHIALHSRYSIAD